MRCYLISDNVDTQMGMRIAGVEGVVVHKHDEVMDALKKAAGEMGGDLPAAGKENEPGSPVKGVILPEARKPFCYSSGKSAEPAHTENGTGTAPEEKGTAAPTEGGEGGRPETAAEKEKEKEEETGGYGRELRSCHAQVSDGWQKRIRPEDLSMPSCARQDTRKSNSGSRDKGHPPGIAATA